MNDNFAFDNVHAMENKKAESKILLFFYKKT